jgi:Rrf2 family protein
MKVSKKVDYGVRALVDLAQWYGKGPVQTIDIAARQGIPESYLEQLLPTLNRFGFIHSRRGPQGGHVLAKSPNHISLGMVMAGLEGTTAALECITEPAECNLSSICAQRDVWKSVEDAVNSVLSATSIADLADKQSQLQEQSPSIA